MFRRVQCMQLLLSLLRFGHGTASLAWVIIVRVQAYAPSFPLGSSSNFLSSVFKPSSTARVCVRIVVVSTRNGKRKDPPPRPNEKKGKKKNDMLWGRCRWTAYGVTAYCVHISTSVQVSEVCRCATPHPTATPGVRGLFTA
ncbi:hypothetical protein BXZ70DRAFT_932110 [Cristinia sonorae]|uniref:Uncharacterized protein n=1 Tax=Cristinia sonorae TaxID=1940300 RepID=A0A8K0UQK0_9AGAR|nr:hypothetical protein BXZ70DRAFT_932110 [Cristinia sonorae]